MAIIAGVDEAGRGSVLGPLFVAGVAIRDDDVPALKELGVRDSKLLSPRRRRELYPKIKKIALQVVWEKISPREIDEAVLKGARLKRLNHLEAQYMARVLSGLGRFDHAYVDCCDTVQKRYGELVADLLLERIRRVRNLDISLGEVNAYRERIVSEHHADSNYTIVGAASIIAKVRRDAYILRLQKEHGPFGSGYPSDPATQRYLKGFVERSEGLPSIARASWLTVRRLYEGIKIVEDKHTPNLETRSIEEFVANATG